MSIIASSLPTLRPLITRILPGLGLSSAGTKATNYMRYGPASAARGGHGGSKADAKTAKMQSISVEELTLKDMDPSPSGSISAGVYAHASADPARRPFPDERREERRIFKRTEISVNAESRDRAR